MLSGRLDQRSGMSPLRTAAKLAAKRAAARSNVVSILAKRFAKAMDPGFKAGG
jgi:hypothetical protein